MLYALHEDEKIEATPGFQGATCPTCKETVISKCGTEKIWHWAHQSEGCVGSKPETEWHRGWKKCFPREFTEVFVDGYRADVRIPHQGAHVVIEFQNSPIDQSEASYREAHYGPNHMIWVVNGETFRHKIAFRKKLGPRRYTFRWKWPHRVWATRKAKVVFDFGHRLYLVQKIYNSKYVGGILVQVTPGNLAEAVHCPEAEASIKKQFPSLDEARTA